MLIAGLEWKGLGESRTAKHPPLTWRGRMFLMLIAWCNAWNIHVYITKDIKPGGSKITIYSPACSWQNERFTHWGQYWTLLRLLYSKWLWIIEIKCYSLSSRVMFGVVSLHMYYIHNYLLLTWLTNESVLITQHMCVTRTQKLISASSSKPLGKGDSACVRMFYRHLPFCAKHTE